MRTFWSLFFCATMAAGTAYAQTPPAMPGMEHHHSHAESPEKLGRVSFPTSCAAGSQAGMERGVALLHSFGYTEAQRQFEEIVKNDPGCAMAHWGVAMTQYKELWSRPDASELKVGAEEMAKARSVAAAGKTTARDKGYIGALSAFFDPVDAEYQQRADAYVAKMNALHAAFPYDVEAAAFDALALIASTPQGDTSLTHEHAALAILVPLFAAHPEHPGWRTTSFTRATHRRWQRTGWARRRSMRGLRRLLRMRCTCRRTSLRGWVCGRRTSAQTWRQLRRRRRRRQRDSREAHTRCMRTSS